MIVMLACGIRKALENNYITSPLALPSSGRLFTRTTIVLDVSSKMELDPDFGLTLISIISGIVNLW